VVGRDGNVALASDSGAQLPGGWVPGGPNGRGRRKRNYLDYCSYGGAGTCGLGLRLMPLSSTSLEDIGGQRSVLDLVCCACCAAAAAAAAIALLLCFSAAQGLGFARHRQRRPRDGRRGGTGGLGTGAGGGGRREMELIEGGDGGERLIVRASEEGDGRGMEKD